MFFPILSYPQLIYFCETVHHKLTYFQLPFIISLLLILDFLSAPKLVTLIDIVMVVEHTDLNALNLSHKCTAQLSNAKNSYIFFEFLYEGLLNTFLFVSNFI